MMHAATRSLEDLRSHAPQTVRPGVMVQRWDDLSFVHWAFEPEAVARLLPQGLAIDTFDGAAWVGVIPFRLSIRLPWAPMVPWVSRFPETNLRTYVRGPDGHRGIWFFSLDATRLGAVYMARRTYRLPYMWAHMRIREDARNIRYSGRRLWPTPVASWFDIEIDRGGRIDALTDLERFLTCRWRLYSPRPLALPAAGVRFASTIVDHRPWPLHEARVRKVDGTLLDAAGLPSPREAPIAWFSPSVTVRFDRRHSVAQSTSVA
jgi:uncharacterized protein YqjF (DUF2071 family)